MASRHALPSATSVTSAASSANNASLNTFNSTPMDTLFNTHQNQTMYFSPFTANRSINDFASVGLGLTPLFNNRSISFGAQTAANINKSQSTTTKPIEKT
jgi:hypothetical protein